jgi:adenylate cyclase class IV
VLNVKVENEVNLYRDLTTGAIVNTDSAGHQKYLKQRAAILESRKNIDKNSKDIEELKGEIGDIKQMLTQILANVQK